MKKKQINKTLIVLSLIVSLVCSNSISPVKANDGPPPLENDSQKDMGSMTTVKPQIGSAQPSNINLQQLPSLIDIPQTSESIEKVLKMEEEGEKLFKQHLLDKALAKFQEAYGLSIEMKYAEGEGRNLTNMGRVFLEHGQFIKAKYMGENAIEVLSGVSDKKALGRAHLYLAQAYFGLDNPVWAGQQLDYAMKSFTADGGNNAGDTAKLMAIAAGVILKAGKLKEALQFLQASAMYYGQAGDNANAIASRISVVNVLLALGLYTAAQEEVEKAISVARTEPDQLANLTAALCCLANCKYSFGDYKEAKKIYLQVLGYAKKIPNDQLTTAGRANIYLGYGTTLAALHEYSQAKQALEFALPVFKAAGNSLAEAQASNSLGIVEWRLGHAEKAKELLQQALDLHNLITPKQEFFRVTVLQNIAIVEAQMGFNREAKAHLETAAGQLKKSKDNTNLGRTYFCLVETMLKLADQAEAERLLTQAMELSQGVADDACLWREYTLLAKLQLMQGNTKAAHESLASAISFLHSPQAGDYTSFEHMYYMSERKEMAHQLILLLVQEKMLDEAFLISEQLKQEAFLANFADCDTQIATPEADLYADLVTTRAHLHAAEAISAPNKVTKEWQNWLGRYRTLLGQNRRLARLIAPVPVSIADITRNLQTHHATIVDYVVGNHSTIVFTVNESGKVSAEILNIGNKQLNAQVNTLLNSFAHDTGETDHILSDRVLHSLSTALLPEQLKTLLPKNPDELVVIIPDAPLDSVPFAALMDSANNYLVTKHTIMLSSTLTALLDNVSPPTEIPGFLFVAGDSKISNQADNMDQLKNIGQNLPSSVVTYLDGTETNLKKLQEECAGKMAVQIAGNIGLANNGLTCELPVKKENTSPTFADLLANQLSCDAFVLSGTSVNKVEDQSRNALSPINTLGCALRYAGVRNGVINIWTQPVAGQNAQNNELSEFYKEQLSGAHPAVALRKAELAQLSRDTRPATWASFQIFGTLY